MDTIEMKAREIGNNRKQLRSRLLSARSVLIDQVKQRFSKRQFDLRNKRLISDDGKLSLQWLVRLHADMPVDYENQQTSVGTVRLRIVE